MSRHRHAYRVESRPPHRSHGRSGRQIGMGCSLLFLLPFLAGGVALVIVTLNLWGGHRDAQARAAIYQKAPGCASAPTATGASDGCIWSRATVSSTEQREEDDDESVSYSYYVMLQLADGAVRTVEIPDESDWSRLSQGDVVTAELWNGAITQIATPGGRFPTTDSPLYGRDHPGLVLLFGMAGAAVGFSAALALAVRRVFRNGSV